MAGSGGGRSLEQTPTWAVAIVCFVLVLISIIIEHIIHLIGKWFTKKHKQALYEALEKIKSELMMMGFLSLLLTVGQGPISNICISEKVGNTWNPCREKSEETTSGYTESNSDESSETDHGRKLLIVLDSGKNVRRFLAEGGTDKCASKGKVSFMSTDGIHQLHIFIFVLAVFHVLYCIITMALGRAKMRRWKVWEKETKSIEYQFSHDPQRFRFTRDTSFGRRHLSFWSESPILLWIVCFFRQFFRSVLKVDYLTLRHGFIMAHLAPKSHTNFDFQKYIRRSLEKDFKKVVGISPLIWLFAVMFLLFSAYGSYSFLWIPSLPLLIILMVGTKLQVIITKMGLDIQQRGEVVQGVPIVHPGDNHFWFNRPRLILYLLHFVLFQNAFQLAFFFWSWYEFGFPSCFYKHWPVVAIKISMGVLVQILCSYVTLPLYALVTQMGSTMKPTIFDEKVAMALRKWHQTARKQIKHNRRNSGTVTPLSSRPTTPAYGMSSVLPFHRYRGDNDSSLETSPRMSNFEHWEVEASPSPSYHHHHHHLGDSESYNGYPYVEEQERESQYLSSAQPPMVMEATYSQYEIDIVSKDFSFDKRASL